MLATSKFSASHDGRRCFYFATTMPPAFIYLRRAGRFQSAISRSSFRFAFSRFIYAILAAAAISRYFITF
jgi:hypothetical protein